MKAHDSPLITQVNLSSTAPQIDRSLKDQLTKDLSPEDLSKIKQGFDLYRGTVDLKQFIIIMLQALYNSSELQSRQKQILTFIEMFLLIDLRNLKKIKFEDFTNYLIDKQSNKTNIEQYQFFPSQNLNSLDFQTDGVFTLLGNKMFGMLENSKKQVALVQTKTYKKHKIIGLGGNIINNVIYLPDYDVFVLATNDKHLNCYETGDDTLVQRFSCPDTIQFMLYLEDQKMLICGCTNGKIYQFSTKRILANMKKQNKSSSSEADNTLKNIPPQDLYKHFMINKVCKNQDDLTCMEILKSLQMLITGANDSKVRIYEIRQNGLKMCKQLDGHYKGIKAVTTSVHHKIIVSCSFDFDVLVWNAYLEHPVARLEGHQASLVSAYCPKQHEIIITLDARSVMKIWSSQKYHLIQNIVVYQNLQPNTTIRFCYKQQLNLAIVYTRKLLFFKYAVNYDPKLTDDNEITAIKYSNKNLQVYIGSNRSLKVWCIQKGVQKRNYINIVDSQICILQIDQRHRRCFIGCLNGDIYSLDLFSGLIIQSYSSHKNQISFLKYNYEHNLLISGGWDRKIKIHNDTNHLERIQSRQNVLRNINNVSEKDLAGGCFSLKQLFTATFCKTPFVKIWDFEKVFLEAQYVLPYDVCQVEFIDPYPLILITDVKGSIFIFTTKYYTPSPYKLLTQWKNMFSIQKSSQITYLKSQYDPKTQQCEIIFGDQYGYIRIISLTEFIQQLGIKPINPQIVGNKNPYRIQDYNYRNISETSGANIHDFSKHSCTNLVPPPSIRQKLQIKGHNQKINYVEIIRQSEEELILSASSDCMVKIWRQNGQSRGIMRQGSKQNKSWRYGRNMGWKNNQVILYEKIKNQLQQTQDDYFFKKRMQTVPFTMPQKFEQATNQDIYKNLKQIDSLLYKPTQYKPTRRF